MGRRGSAAGGGLTSRSPGRLLLLWSVGFIIRYGPTSFCDQATAEKNPLKRSRELYSRRFDENLRMRFATAALGSLMTLWPRPMWILLLSPVSNANWLVTCAAALWLHSRSRPISRPTTKLVYPVASIFDIPRQHRRSLTWTLSQWSSLREKIETPSVHFLDQGRRPHDNTHITQPYFPADGCTGSSSDSVR